MAETFEQQFAQFQRDIAGHAMTVLRDDGLYRHLRCKCGDSYIYGFDIVTWPGHLAYTGDTGTFVFSRIPDMLEFFRGRTAAMIDRCYLAEKCLAADKHDGIEEFSSELFAAAVREDFEAYAGEPRHGQAIEGDVRDELWERVEEEVLGMDCDGIGAAVTAAMSFTDRGAQVFPDFYEHRLTRYTTRFWWACYAIPWAIAQYDALKKTAPAEAAQHG